MNRHAQTGITLVMSLIMLVVLTLLVVSAIRFGNINLRIAGNAQTEVEAAAATQVAVEQMLGQVNAAVKVDLIPAQSMAISTGGTTFTVNVAKPVCTLTRNVMNTELDSTNPKHLPCYGSGSTESRYDAAGRPIPDPTECKDQLWEVAANLSDTATGARVSMLQGVALRVSSEVGCP